MAQGFISSRPFRIAVVALIAAAAVLTLLFLGAEVTRKLRQLDTAQSDNIQWTLAQAEVEFLELEITVLQEARQTRPNLRTLRREFDIFYSRIATLREGALFASLREDAAAAAVLDRISGYLDRAVAWVDADDATLTAALPEFAAATRALHADVRAVSVAGLEHFARQADQQRAGISETLFRLAVAATVLLTMAALAAVVMQRLYRLSERRAADVILASNRMQTIVDTSLDAIIVANRMGRIVEFNPAAEIIFGHRREDVISRLMSKVIIPEKHRAAHEAGMDRFRRTGEKRVAGVGRIQLEALRSNGTVFPIEMAIQAAESADGTIFVSFIRDISHRLAAERDLIEARDQAVAGEKAKTEFLAVMSHEIRTPLNGLLGTLSLLRDTRLTERQKGHVETMETSGALLLHHINDVLDVTKYEAGKLELSPEPVDLGALAQGVIDGQRGLAAAGDNVLGWHWAGAAPGPCLADPRRLRQILVNLVGNAVKFTRAGRITLELQVERLTDADAQIIFRVIDTGIGIAPDDLGRVFRDFETGDTSYTRQAGGTGLGLGISRRLAGAMGGEIGADSTPGKGSVFWLRVTLPRTNELPAAEPLPPAPVPATAPTRSLNVLIVEDNEINRTVLREMLTNDGHQVKTAHDGQEGVAAAMRQRFDLILMDISMPVMDGLAATRAIRGGDGPSRDTPIIAVTAHAMPAEIAAFHKQGMTGYLAKPIDRQKLRQLYAGAVDADALTPSAPRNDRWAELEGDLGADTLTRLLGRFVEDGDATMTHVTDTAAPGWDAADVAARCHKLAGSAAIFNFPELRTRLAGLQTALQSGAGKQAVADDLAALEEDWQAARMEIAARGV